MKALKVLGVILALLAGAVFIFWLGWLRPPSAEDVCENVAEIAEKESGVEMPKANIDACIQNASTRPKFGLMPWVKSLKCMRDAESSAELEACTRR